MFGRVTGKRPLIFEPRMVYDHVTFSDCIEKDFLEFNSGKHALIAGAKPEVVLVE